MNNKFDELTKSLAQSVTRRAAFRKLGLGLVAAIAASLGISSASAQAGQTAKRGYCQILPSFLETKYSGLCVDPTTCEVFYTSDCKGPVHVSALASACSSLVDTKRRCG